MKSNIISSIKLSLLLIIVFSGIYTVFIWGVAQLMPNSGRGEMITHHHKTFYANIGQSFTSDAYFNGRPSAVAYNAAGSGGSNKGPYNADYLLQVKARIDTFLIHNPGIHKEEIPIDLITASGSGLDPNISVQAAMVQVKRIAFIRKIDEDVLINLINQNIEKPFLGLFGPAKINVLKSNIALDK